MTAVINPNLFVRCSAMFIGEQVKVVHARSPEDLAEFLSGNKELSEDFKLQAVTDALFGDTWSSTCTVEAPDVRIECCG